MFPVKRLHVLLTRIQRPLAVVVGSALSVTRGSGTPSLGVPDVNAMIQRIRSRMAAEGLDDDFDEAMRDAQGSCYQAAFGYVQSTCGPKLVDEIVREAVLEARLPGSPTFFDNDGDPIHWHLPRGTAALGRLLAAEDPRFRGPILTTNFDPLLSMAIEYAGGAVDRRILDRDGHLPSSGDSKHGVPVVHLHGYWRGATLHLPHHLTAPRDKLLGSLRELLGGYTVLVVAYGGWDDMFMHALAQVLDQPETSAEILWCLYGDEATAGHNNRELLNRFGRYPAFTPYFGVDGHELFEQLASACGSPEATNGRGVGIMKQRPADTRKLFPAHELDRYLARLEAEHATVPLIGFQTKTRLSLALDDLYVPLDAIIDRGGRARDVYDSAEVAQRAKVEDARLYQEQFALADAFTRADKLGRRSLVLLGDPGSGKTTHLKQVLLKVIREGPEALGLAAATIPVFLPLQSVSDRKAKLAGLIREQLQGPALDMPADFGDRLLAHGKLLLLLDGLDEVADATQRAEVSRWIEAAHRDLPDAVMLVSCRYAGYTTDVELDAVFLELHLRPLGEAQMQTFVRNWYRLVLREQMVDYEQAASKAKGLADDLLTALARPEFVAAARVYEMTRNPLLLTAICLVHHDHGRLPHARAKLYDETIAVLLERWHHRPGGRVMRSEEALDVLRPVAAWMHGERGRRRAGAEELLPPVGQALKTLNAKLDAGEFLRTIRDESGLLTGWGVDEYGFMHLGLQEFLTAQQLRNVGLTNDEVFDQLAAQFVDSWWQEVILLMLAQRNPSVFEPFMRVLVRRPEFAKWAESQMMDLSLDEAAVKSAAPFVELLQARGEDADDLSERQVAAAKMLSRKMPEVLEELEGVLVHHPAPAVRTWWSRRRDRAAIHGGNVIVHDKTGIEMMLIPEGSFVMGSPDDDQLGFDDERPRHEVNVTKFHLAKTPVTNAQYGRYLAAHPDAPKPRYWGDRRFNQPDQPVVGVSWDDAMAYCEWSGLVLPTEAQWEYACRAGTTTRYWSGNEESDLARVGWYRGNSDDRLHAVGEKEANPFGLYDMHGNVWEWCRDGWVRNYETEPQSGDGLRREPVAQGLRVIRGGSWDHDARYARSAYRHYWHPGLLYLAFRPAQVAP